MKDFIPDTNNAIPYPGPIPRQKDPYGLISLLNILTPTDMAEVLEKVVRLHTKRIACCMCDDTCTGKPFPQEPPNPPYRYGPRRNDVSLQACFNRAAKMANERQKAASNGENLCIHVHGMGDMVSYPCACEQEFTTPDNPIKPRIPIGSRQEPWSGEPNEWGDPIEPQALVYCQTKADENIAAGGTEPWDVQVSKCMKDQHDRYLKRIEEDIACNDTIKIYDEAIKTCRGQYGPPPGRPFAPLPDSFEDF